LFGTALSLQQDRGLALSLSSRNPSLAPGTINPRLGAVRRLAYEAADGGLLSSDLAAGVRRVKGVKKLGIRLGNWSTAEQGHALWQAPNRQRLKGKRDRALLALLLACGLRRQEAVTLTLDHLQQREEHWAIVDLVGKGGHVRTIPVPDWVRTELDDWLAAAAIDRGKLFRRVNKVGRAWGDGMGLDSATHREASWSRSNFSWGTFRCKLPTTRGLSGNDAGRFAQSPINPHHRHSRAYAIFAKSFYRLQ
jgi:integrase